MNVHVSTAIHLPLTGSMRSRIEAAIEGLVALLDTIDGDTDLEPDNDDEPSLGWLGHVGDHIGVPAGDDRELEDELYEDGGDGEEDDPAEWDHRDDPGPQGEGAGSP